MSSHPGRQLIGIYYCLRAQVFLPCECPMRLLAVLLLLLLLNSAYLAAFASPTLFYMTNVLAHLLLGGAFTLIAVWKLRARAGWIALSLLTACSLLGVWLIKNNL